MIAKNVTKASLIAIFLMLIITATSILVALPTASAHYPPWNNTTYTYVAPSPAIIGVGQQMIIVWWINAIPPTAAGESGDRWIAYIDVIKPDGTNDTYGPLTSDPVGGGYIT